MLYEERVLIFDENIISKSDDGSTATFAIYWLKVWENQLTQIRFECVTSECD